MSREKKINQRLKRKTRSAVAGDRSQISAAALQPYQGFGSDTGIAAYGIGRDSITVRFKTGGTYLYNYASTGREKIEAMKRLAKNHDGLNTYISQHVREDYAEKLS